MESEFFGHEKGAFTGATERREGRFELANGGTLLLDEISEISPRLQAKLLRVLQEREFERVGGSKTIQVDVRVLATTNRDLKKSVEKGDFREDLFYRLNVFPVAVPPLRERAGDVRRLAEHFLERFARQHGRNGLKISPLGLRAMEVHPWPGNVRELQNTIERAVILSDPGTAIGAGVLGLPPVEGAELEPQSRVRETDRELGRSAKGSKILNEVAPFEFAQPGQLVPLSQVEKQHILQTLEACDGNRTRAASALEISIRTLRNKLNEYRVAST